MPGPATTPQREQDKRPYEPRPGACPPDTAVPDASGDCPRDMAVPDASGDCPRDMAVPDASGDCPRPGLLRTWLGGLRLRAAAPAARGRGRVGGGCGLRHL